jgi:hypothetical protein
LTIDVQQTRFQLLVLGSGDRLRDWAANPWRRWSLQLIVLSVSFSIGGILGAISGTIAVLDPIGALACVVAIEMAARLRGPLLRRRDQAVLLGLLDMARIGLLYGLLLEGFKLL